MTTETLNFSILGAVNTPLTATGTSQRVDLSTETGQDDIMIINPSSTDTIYVRTGDDTVEADITAMPVLPGEKGIYFKGRSRGKISKLAYFTDGAPVQFMIVAGRGN